LVLFAGCETHQIRQLAGFDRGIELAGPRVTLLSWNVQKVHDPRIAEELEALIARHEPDLVFIQEARADAPEPDQLGGYFADGWSYPWDGGPTIGVLTLSGASPVRAQAVRSQWREFFVTAPKVSLVTEYRLADGATLLAVNVHLLNFEKWNPFMLRAQLADLEAVMAAHDGPTVMAGDFNTWNEHRLELVGDLASRLGLTEITSFEPGRTTGDLGSEIFNGLFGIAPGLPLDRVYVRGFAAVSARVLAKGSSDHRPILVTLAPVPQ
jgi:endonuclease/exonuclease/phosphatase (EEP) superfamily protein YafD